MLDYFNLSCYNWILAIINTEAIEKETDFYFTFSSGWILFEHWAKLNWRFQFMLARLCISMLGPELDNWRTRLNSWPAYLASYNLCIWIFQPVFNPCCAQVLGLLSGQLRRKSGLNFIIKFWNILMKEILKEKKKKDKQYIPFFHNFSS